MLLRISRKPGLKLLLCLALSVSASAQSSYIINGFAGNHTSGTTGDGGPATAARLQGPAGTATDSAGNVYIADYSGCVVRKVDPSGVISGFAGTAGTCTSSGDGGQATSATLNSPWHIAIDSADNVYIAEYLGYKIRKVNSSGVISTIAGTGSNGFVGDGGPATAATIYGPMGMVFDTAGNLYIAEWFNNRVRKINTSGIISVFAGGGSALGDGGAATAANLSNPIDVALDPSGNLYIADSGHSRVRKIDTSGIITTAAGTGTSGFSGDNGPATSAKIAGPYSIATDSSGNLFIGHVSGGHVRRVTPAGIIESVAGGSSTGYSGDGGPALSALVGNIWGLSASNGKVYISDTSNSVVRVLTGARITALPSTPLGSTSAVTTAILGVVSGLGTTASLVYGSEFSVNTGSCVYVSTPTFQASCPITFTPQHVGTRRDALKVTDINGNIVGVQYLYGIGQGTLSSVTPGTISTVNLGSVGAVTPAQFTFDPAGNLYFAEYPGGRIIKMTPGGTVTSVSLAGLGGAVPLNLVADWAGNLDMVDSTGRLVQLAPDGTVTVLSSSLNLGSLIGQLAISPSGSFYICDISNNRVVKVALDGSTTSVLSLTSTLSTPGALTFDDTGNLYITNQGNSTIVKLTPAGVSSVLTVTPAIQVPAGIHVDAAGNLYIVDAGANKLFRVASNGAAAAIAGTGNTGNSGDGGPSTSAMITPSLVALDADGTIYLGDRTNHLIREISSPSTLAFSNTLIGSSSSINPSITNIGNQPYTFPSSFSFAANQTPFSINTGGAGDCSALFNSSFAAGATCNLALQFTPPSATSFTDTLAVAVGIQLPLSGLGVLPLAGAPSVNVTTLSFGTVTNGSTSAAQSVTLSNTGTATLNVTSAVLSGTDIADFSLANSCSSTLSAGSQCAVAVTFHPSSTGAKTATLTITDADATTLTPQTQIITLSGSGSPPLGQPTLSVSTVVFPSQAPGTTATPQMVTLTNTGNATLTVTSVTLTGTNASEFALTNSCGASVAVGASCTVQLDFSPISEGSKAADLVFLFNNGVNPVTSTVTLTGISTPVVPVSAVPTGPISIISMRSGKALDVLGASALNGVPLQQYDYLAGTNQLWEAVPVDATYYQIRSVGTQKVLDAKGVGTANGTPIQQWNYLGSDNQKWQFVPQADGSFEIVNKLSGRALDVLGASIQNEARIQLWDYNATDNQKWQLTSVTLPTPQVQYYTIASLATGKVLDVVGASQAEQARIQQFDYLYGPNQQWQFVQIGVYYKVVSRSSGKVLDAENTVPGDGAPVQQYSDVGLDSQLWELFATENGYYQMVNKGNGKSLDVTGMSSANGAMLQTYTYLGGLNQQFQIVPVAVP